MTPKAKVINYLNEVFADKTNSYPKLTEILQNIMELGECNGREAANYYIEWSKHRSAKLELVKAID